MTQLPDDLLAKEFKPCVTYGGEDFAPYAEMRLRDCATVWRHALLNGVDLGYCMVEGDLVAIRVWGVKHP